MFVFFASYCRSQLPDAIIAEDSPLEVGMASHFITSRETHLLIVLDPCIENCAWLSQGGHKNKKNDLPSLSIMGR